ncbi:MAG: beta-galactosidase [Oscillospiraceae bacterium]|nr:beta-galactosidase [Oscillospiraceae bacterium]
MNKEKFYAQFAFGSHLCRKPMPPMCEMKRDMEILKSRGFNLIKIQAHWGLDEPAENIMDTAAYEELVDYAGKLDMGVYMGLTNEQAPNWLWEKYPDCRMTAHNGSALAYQAQYTLPADGKPGPCYDHPGAMAAQLDFTARFVERLSVYENIVIWNTWQEIGYWSEHLTGGHVCYCDNTMNFFREWLKGKYKNLDALNRALSVNYSDWKYIAPDRQNGTSCLPMDFEWQYFMNHVQIGNVLQKRCETIKAHDMHKRPVFAHKSAPAFASGMDHTYARCQDFLGSSSYPAWSSGDGRDDCRYDEFGRREKYDALFAETFNGICLNFDFLRSSNRFGAHTWAAELQGGPVSTGFHLGRVPSASDIRRWLLGLLGSGVTGISFWVTRAEIMAGEMNGFSLLDNEGSTTERLEEAGNIAKFINKYPDLFNTPAAQRAQVGIIVDEDNYIGCSRLAQGGDGLGYSMRGWYKYMFDNNISVDFVHAEELGEEYIGSYKLLVMPFPLFMSDKTAENFGKYVEDGGFLVSEATPGRIRENGMTRRETMAMRDIFGVKHKSLKMVSEPNYGHRFTPGPRTWGEYLDPAKFAGAGIFEGYDLPANLYVQCFELDKAEEILQFDQMTAGALNCRGKGRAVIIGSYIGHSAAAYRNDSSDNFVKKLLSVAGVAYPDAKGVNIRERRADKKKAYIIFNTTSEIQKTALPPDRSYRYLDSYGGKVSKCCKECGLIFVECEPLEAAAVVLQS